MTEELKNFYPTPQILIEKMVKKINRDILKSDIKILEPSAGRGDIVDYINDNCNKVTGYYNLKRLDIDCIELNSNLQKILIGKKLRVIYDNFLEFSTYKDYDLIIMNPPFDNGEKHLLKAISLIENRGGQIICLLNAETLKNPYSIYRKDLINKFDKLNAKVEFFKDEFKKADRKTNVEIALIDIYIPKKILSGNLLTEMLKDKYNQQEKNIEFKSLTFYEQIKNLISRYNFEIEAGINLIREFKTINKFTKTDEDSYTKLNLVAGSYHSDLSEYDYIKIIRFKYWKRLYYKKELESLLTNSIRKEYFDNIQNMENYDFNEFNIKQMLKNISENMEVSLKNDIIQLFESFSIKHYWTPETANNIHYYNGWATNKSYYINKKVIVPINCLDTRYDTRFSFSYEVKAFIKDLHKIFIYLDSQNVNQENIEIHKIEEIFINAQREQLNKNIEFPYFIVNFYKKGTCHIKFKNDDLLLKFNIYGSRMKNWLPPTYGRKKYQDMSKEEKDVINSFQGEKSYNNVTENYNKYIYEIKNTNLLTF